jgi:hypothetical protein
VRRFLGRFKFITALVIIAAFVVFTIVISKPPPKVERHALVEGTVIPADELKPEAPLVRYVGLNKGAPTAAGAAPEFALDDRQLDAGERFELSADRTDGSRFWVLGRVETATLDRYCTTIPLPPMRQLENGDWVARTTGKPLPPLEITVTKRTPC